MSNNRNYKVGYGKPPRAHQFKPGESGCRSGGHDQRRANIEARKKAERAKETEDRKQLVDIVGKVARERVRVRTKAGEQEMHRVEAIVRKALDRPFQEGATDRDLALVLRILERAKLLEPAPEKGRAMVLVVNQTMEAEAWAKATEGELLPKDPLHGIPGAEGLLDTPFAKRGDTSDRE